MIVDMSENNGSGGKRLLRLRNGRMVAGVCAGLAAYFGVDVRLVRLAFGIFTFFYGLGILIYLIAWAIMPEEGEKSSILESFVHRFLGQGSKTPAGRDVGSVRSATRLLQAVPSPGGAQPSAPDKVLYVVSMPCRSSSMLARLRLCS